MHILSKIKRAVKLLCILGILLSVGCRDRSDLSREIKRVDEQLEHLPKIQPNLLCPTVGFGSAIFPDPDHTSWLDITFPEPRKIDTVVLIPALLKNKVGGLETLGFPLRFTVETWRDKKPGTQSVKLGTGGWMYQSIGIYDPNIHPNELCYHLSLNQSRFGAGSAPVTISLYYCTSGFNPADGLDVHKAPGMELVGKPQILEPWSDWAVAEGKHSPRQVSSSFNLDTVPAGATLFLRISNETAGKSASVDNIKLNSPFVLNNGDFETPEIPPQGNLHNIVNWYDNTNRWTATQQSKDLSGATYRSGSVVVDYSKTDFPNPGVAPVVFELPPGTVAEKVRLRSICMQKEISWRKEFGHNFAINEVLLFDGDENIALNSSTASSDNENFPLMFDSKYAVDGYSYFPPVNPKEVSKPYNELIHNDKDSRKLLFDLGRTYTLNEARFYPVDRSPQFSHIYAMGIGFPRNITLRMSEEPTPQTSDTTFSIDTLHQIGASPLFRRLPTTTARYVWIEMDKGQIDPRTGEEALGLSELELLQHGTNVVAGILPLSPIGSQQKYRQLTDGLTSSGIIMPQKEWLLKLYRRAQLERKRDQFVLKQRNKAEKQARLLRLLQITFLSSLFAVVLIVLLIRKRYRNNLRREREKIGANLHDEVGASLFSIAISSETLNQTCKDDSPKTRRLIANIHRVAHETATEIRLLSRFLEKQGVESNIIGQFRRVEHQMLPKIEVDSHYDAPEQFNTLLPIKKWELVLFFKEALHNIAKHSCATHAKIQTQANDRQLQLVITDNGKGLPDDSHLPVHLTQRAEKLQAQLKLESSVETGTSIQLTIPRKRRRLL